MDTIIETIGSAIEFLGIAVIAIGAGYAIIRIVMAWLRKNERVKVGVPGFRKDLGKAIMLGLEFLVAGDIINTVAVRPSFRSVGLLAAIVLIRTFLSFSLEIEMTGTLPWARARHDSEAEQ